MTKKKTHEDFIIELRELNPDIEVLSKYDGNKVKVLCRCKVDGNMWEATPNSLLRGHGCAKCYYRRSSAMRTKSHEQFISELREINPNIEVLDRYINNSTKVRCRCLIDNYEWRVKPNGLLSGEGCPKCAGTMLKTHDQFIREMQSINPDVEILGRYVNNRARIKCRCRIDGYEWNPIPKTLLKGYGCPRCGNCERKTQKQFIDEMKHKQPDIEILGEYVGNKVKIKCRCKIDGYVWKAKPNSLLHGEGCPKCGGSMLKSHEQFITEMNEVNPNIEILSEYVNRKTKVKCKCKIHGYEWGASPNNLIHGTGCPICRQSQGEKKVEKFLKANAISYKPQYKFKDCKDINVMPFDFAIFIDNKVKAVIEYQGKQHYKPIKFFGGQEKFKKQKKRDAIKKSYCKEHNIKFIEIPYWIANIYDFLKEELKEENL